MVTEPELNGNSYLYSIQVVAEKLTRESNYLLRIDQYLADTPLIWYKRTDGISKMSSCWEILLYSLQIVSEYNTILTLSRLSS